MVGLIDLTGLLQPEWSYSYNIYNVIGALENWLWVISQLFSCWKKILSKKKQVLLICGYIILVFFIFNLWWCIHLDVDRRKCWRWTPSLLFSFFPPYLFLYYIFPIQTFDGKLFCCQDLSFLSMRYFVSESVEWHLFQWRKDRVAGGGANELWQTPPFFHGVWSSWSGIF